MAKVITFSRFFPEYHVRKGQKTFFVEKILNQIGIKYTDESYLHLILELNALSLMSEKLTYSDLVLFQKSLINISGFKKHTMRNGFRFKQEECFLPKVWSSLPYRSYPIIFSPTINIKKIWTCKKLKDLFSISKSHPLTLEQLSHNDGLEETDFKLWFNKPFYGQIICWDENVNYQ